MSDTCRQCRYRKLLIELVQSVDYDICLQLTNPQRAPSIDLVTVLNEARQALSDSAFGSFLESGNRRLSEVETALGDLIRFLDAENDTMRSGGTVLVSAELDAIERARKVLRG